MTTMIMVQTPDDVIIGWDSQMTAGREKSGATTPKFFVKGGIVIGVAGTFAALDQIETMDLPDYDGSDPRRWIIETLAPRVRATLTDIPGVVGKDGSYGKVGVFAVVDGQAFEFDNLLSATQSTEGVYAMGTGGEYARGALIYIMGTEGYIDRSGVFEALAVASQIDIYTGGPLTVTSAANYLKGYDDE